ncbi:glycerol kinase GlpK [Myxococcota bacterium]|nr:glycerol kinase GlpK [Myxococcota bacterium]
MKQYILAIDQGTTGSTALVIDRSLSVRGRHTEEFPQIYPQPGWVEHDPEAILASVGRAVTRALAAAGVDAAELAAIGITNQRETTVVWDRQTGRAIHPAIVWQDRRTAPRCQELRAEGYEALFRRRTGLVLDPYFSGTKIAWILDAVDGARARAQRGELAFGTIDSLLVWRLTGGVAHVTDASNASRTLLLDVHTLQWDEGLCGLLRVPMGVLPAVRGCSEVYGLTRSFPGLPDGIPVAGMAGDQQAALFGQACFGAGEAKCTYGTGAFLLMNTGERAIESHNGLLTTVAWRLGGQTTYALEGSTFIAGAAVQWLRDGLGLISSAREIEALAARVPDSEGVCFVPALTGLGAPHWRPDARGVITGLTRGTTAAHLARAALEGIAFQCFEVLEAMQKDLGRPLAALKVDGGAAANDLLMQFQADLLGVSLVRPAMLETTALGAACLAGLGVGLFPDLAAVTAAWREDRRFDRALSEEDVARRVATWRIAVAKA